MTVASGDPGAKASNGTKVGEVLPVQYETPGGSVALSSDLVRKYLVRGGGIVSDTEVMMFLSLCKYQKINPFLSEAYLIKYGKDDPAAMVVGKDCLLKRAARNSKYQGHEVGDSEDGQTAWAQVHVEGYKVPIRVEVHFSEYVGKKRDGNVTKMWTVKKRTMLKKVALSQALREAFPEDLSQMYVKEEFDTDAHPDTLTGKPEVTPTTKRDASKKVEQAAAKVDNGKGKKPSTPAPPAEPMHEGIYKKAVEETVATLNAQGLTSDEISGILVKAGYLADTAAAEPKERAPLLALLQRWMEKPATEEVRSA